MPCPHHSAALAPPTFTLMPPGCVGSILDRRGGSSSAALTTLYHRYHYHYRYRYRYRCRCHWCQHYHYHIPTVPTVYWADKTCAWWAWTFEQSTAFPKSKTSRSSVYCTKYTALVVVAHLDPTLPLWVVVQDLIAVVHTQPTTHVLDRSCRLYGSDPATWSRSYRSGTYMPYIYLEDLDHLVLIAFDDTVQGVHR